MDDDLQLLLDSRLWRKKCEQQLMIPSRQLLKREAEGEEVDPDINWKQFYFENTIEGIRIQYTNRYIYHCTIDSIYQT